MAKKKEDRYSSAEELLVDLEAVREGQPPIRAHKRFDVSVLEQLEEGAVLEGGEPQEVVQVVTRYRTYLLMLGAVSAILVLIVVLLLLR